MKINSIKRPWIKEGQRRYAPDPRYQSSTWKKYVRAHKQGFTRMPDGFMLSNLLCYDCYLEGKTTPMNVVDHHTRVKDGADFGKLILNLLNMLAIQVFCSLHRWTGRIA